MTWFVANIVSRVEAVDGQQADFPIWEDAYLFEAHSKDELEKKIMKQVRTIEAAGECNYDGKPARQRCIGVRKIRSIYNADESLDQEPPRDGTELTHSFLVAASLEQVAAYARGEEVILRCVDDANDPNRWSMYFASP